MTIDLYTATDVKKTREKLLQSQKGLCRITEEPVVKPCLDHAHDSNCLVRGVLSHGINIFVGQIENAYRRRVAWWCSIPLPALLRRIAEYLENPDKEASGYRHVSWMKRLQIDFNKLPEASKRSVLSSLGSPEGSNGAERKKLFQRVLKSKEHTFEHMQEVINKGG
jgi:hypothetical protein